MFTSFLLVGMWIKYIKQIWQSQMIIQSTTDESVCSQIETKIKNNHINVSGACLVLFASLYLLFIYLFFYKHQITYIAAKFMVFKFLVSKERCTAFISQPDDFPSFFFSISFYFLFSCL